MLPLPPYLCFSLAGPIRKKKAKSSSGTVHWVHHPGHRAGHAGAEDRAGEWKQKRITLPVSLTLLSLHSAFLLLPPCSCRTRRELNHLAMQSHFLKFKFIIIIIIILMKRKNRKRKKEFLRRFGCYGYNFKQNSNCNHILYFTEKNHIDLKVQNRRTMQCSLKSPLKGEMKPRHTTFWRRASMSFQRFYRDWQRDN